MRRGWKQGVGSAALGLLALLAQPASAQPVPAQPPPATAESAPARAEATDFESYRGVFSMSSLGGSGGQSLVFAWTMHYRGAMPHAAFAFATLPEGRSVWRYVSGLGSPDAARDAAMAGCNRDVARIVPDINCRIAAVDGTLAEPPPGTPVVAPRHETIGPFRAAPLMFRHGPREARGVIIWSHGFGGPARDQRRTSVAGFLAPLNDAGWDVLRYDRDPIEDDIATTLPRLVRGLAAVRAAGYARIVLAGHSRGAWQSILAAGERPDLVDAVIAAAPAAHGDAGEQNNHAVALGDFRRALASLPADRVRLAVLVFDADTFDPSPAERAALVAELATTRAAPTLAVWPNGAMGHTGALDWRFTVRHGACLMSFLNLPPAATPRGIRREICGGG